MNNTEDNYETFTVEQSFMYIQSYLDSIGEEDDEGNKLYMDLSQVYQKARYGVKMKFDLYFHIYGHLTIKTKTGILIYKGKSYDMSDYYTELEQRNILMKKWIRENTDTDTGLPKPY